MDDKININALSKETLVSLLRAKGSREVSLKTIEQDIQNGAPVNPDGTVNFILYASWLLGKVIEK